MFFKELSALTAHGAFIKISYRHLSKMSFLPMKENTMNDDKKEDIVDHGGRRLGIDRRQVDLPFPSKNRRTGDERRSGKDRRERFSYSDETDEQREAFHIKPRR